MKVCQVGNVLAYNLSIGGLCVLISLLLFHGIRHAAEGAQFEGNIAVGVILLKGYVGDTTAEKL